MFWIEIVLGSLKSLNDFRLYSKDLNINPQLIYRIHL